MLLSKSHKIIVGLALFLIIGLLWLAYFYFTLAPVTAAFDLPGTASSTPARVGAVPIVVEKGEGLKEIAQLLINEQLIRSASAFKLYAILSGSAHQLKPGLYTISQSSSTIDIIRSLVSGPAKEISVLIPEGATLAEIDATLTRYGILRKGALLGLRVSDFYDDYPFLRGARGFEGFFFPDTYRFYFGSEPVAIAKVLLGNYATRVSPLIADENKIDWDNIPITRRGIYNSLQITTIASLIEKEVPDSAERKIVADIIYRRLKIGMALQIDATRDYAKEKGLRYDTYANSGLPPGPIASPGLDAIEAALNPKSSSYLFYLSDPKTDKTIFSKTFEEHKANILKYLP